jgi:hypothetical protein
MSALLMVAALALAIRSYWAADRVWLTPYTPPGAHRRQEFGLSASRGRVDVIYQRCVPYRYMNEPRFQWVVDPWADG